MKSGAVGILVRSNGRRTARRGLSTLEVLGCLVAVIVGIWAGATFLGVDLLALGGLAEESGRAARAESSSATASPADSAPTSAPLSAEDGTPKPTRAPSVGEATLAYWNRLRAVVQKEQQLRRRGEVEARNMREVLHVRSDAYRQAAQHIHQIPADLADPESRQLAEEIAAWYDRGADLAEEGSMLLDEGELSAAQGPVGRRWHTAQKQHQAELDLLSRKCSSLRGKLTARYQLRFAELQ